MLGKWLVCVSVAIWLVSVQAQTGPKVLSKNAKEKAIMLTNQDAWKVYEKYVEGWKAISEEQRVKIASEVIAADVQYSTPRHESGGRATMIEDMAAFQLRVPGGHFDVGDVSAHHDVALLTWVMVQADGTVVAKGHDQIRVSSEGKIVSLITFAPPVAKP
jgi:SnoaL-like domain